MDTVKLNWDVTYYDNEAGYVDTYKLAGMTEMDAMTHIIADLEDKPEVDNYSLNEDDCKDHDY